MEVMDLLQVVPLRGGGIKSKNNHNSLEAFSGVIGIDLHFCSMRSGEEHG